MLTWVGVKSVAWVLPKEIATLAHMDFSLLILTLIVAVIATVLAGLYPTWRASRVQPALQLKSN
jgi:putative ABC transport system permease protein